MHIELSYAEGCPAAGALRATTETVLDDLAPQEHIVLTQVSAAERASTGVSAGSPVLRVDGREVGPGGSFQTWAPGTDVPGSSIPREPEIRAAVSQAANQSPVRLPLRHRRLVIVAALMILLGALLGQLLAWGALVTLTGLGILGVAFASNGRRTGPQPYMWATGSAALAWTLATVTVWWEALFDVPAPQQGLTDALFWVGLAAALVAVLSIAIATTARHRLRRRLQQAH